MLGAAAGKTLRVSLYPPLWPNPAAGTSTVSPFRVKNDQSSVFCTWGRVEITVVTMGVIDRAKELSGLDSSDDGEERYVCLACETTFEIQYHSCPTCGSFDVRCARWTSECDN